MPTGILEVKLGSPIGATKSRLAKVLERCQLDCCRARNAAITHWLLWRRQNPNWKPNDHYEPPEAKIKRKGSTNSAPKDPPYAPRLFSRELYNVGRNAAPALSSSIASSCAQEVIARLKAKTPYDHPGARWQWEAILNSEVSLPTWRRGSIPIPKSAMTLKYTDDICSLRFPILSRQSGCKNLSVTVRLHSSDLKTGNRRILQKLANGEMALKDSRITERKGKLYVQFCYDVPTKVMICEKCGCRLVPVDSTLHNKRFECIRHLNSPERCPGTDFDLPKDRVMRILPALADDSRPLVCEWVDVDGNQRRWFIGNGKPLVAEYRRIEARRRMIRKRYSYGCGKGHGKKQFYKSVKPMSRYVKDLCSRFTKQTINDIVKLAIREGCGSILYREPTMPVRDVCWFANKDVHMNWVDFEARLSFKCQVSSIEYDKERIGMQEWNPKRNAG